MIAWLKAVFGCQDPAPTYRPRWIICSLPNGNMLVCSPTGKRWWEVNLRNDEFLYELWMSRSQN